MVHGKIILRDILRIEDTLSFHTPCWENLQGDSECLKGEAAMTASHCS